MNRVHCLLGDAHDPADAALLVDRLLRLRYVGRKAADQRRPIACWHHRMWTVTPSISQRLYPSGVANSFNPGRATDIRRVAKCDWAAVGYV
jgi:hypothetical protein